MTSTVAIPLGQGQVFNVYTLLDQDDYKSQSLWVRDRFLILSLAASATVFLSQSLWVRDRFLMLLLGLCRGRLVVAIPLGQGQVFN